MRTFFQLLSKLVQSKNLSLVVANDPGKTVTVALFVSNTIVTEETVAGDLTPPSGGGMGNQVAVVTGVSQDGNGNVLATWPTVTFDTPTVHDGSEKIYGFAIFDADGDIMCWRKFPLPIVIRSAALAINLVMTLRALGSMLAIAEISGA